MAIFPSNVEFFTFEPVGPEQCIMHVWFYFVGDAAQSDEHREGREKVVAEWTQLNTEDAGICHRIQQGRSCDAYDGGRLAAGHDGSEIVFQWGSLSVEIDKHPVVPMCTSDFEQTNAIVTMLGPTI